MRDVDDADVLRLEIFDEFEQTAGLSQGQTRRRLVHDDDARARAERSRDLDELLLRDRELDQWRAAGKIETEFTQKRICLAIDALAIDQFQKTARGWFAVEKDVGGDVEIVEDAQLLMNKLDAERAGFARRTYLGSLAIDLHRAAVACDGAAQDLHQGRLAGAILTNQRDDLTGADAQADVIERDDAGESLADSLHLQYGRVFCHVFRHG